MAKKLCDRDISTSKPAKIKLATTNGSPRDYDMSRAIAQKGRRTTSAEAEAIEKRSPASSTAATRLPNTLDLDKQRHRRCTASINLTFRSGWKEKASDWSASALAFDQQSNSRLQRDQQEGGGARGDPAAPARRDNCGSGAWPFEPSGTAGFWPNRPEPDVARTASWPTRRPVAPHGRRIESKDWRTAR